MELKFRTEKNGKKKNWNPHVVAGGRWPGTMYGVGGREREGKPPKLWSNFGHGLKTPATGAVDLIELPQGGGPPPPPKC